MTFKQALRLVQQAEYKGRCAQAKVDAAGVQFDNAREVINQKYEKEWNAYCEAEGKFPGYNWGDTLC